MPANAHLTLEPHPASHPAPPFSLHARPAQRSDGGLGIVYRLDGALSDLVVPGPRPPSFADNLWQHTCFEAFIAAGKEAPGYREFNFSPSGEWAAYDFTAYRQRNPDFIAVAAPQIELVRGADYLELSVIVPGSLLPPIATHGRLQLALCAVLESADRGNTYMALHHAAAQADFHHRGGFVLDIADPRHHQEQS